MQRFLVWRRDLAHRHDIFDEENHRVMRRSPTAEEFLQYQIATPALEDGAHGGFYRLWKLQNHHPTRIRPPVEISPGILAPNTSAVDPMPAFSTPFPTITSTSPARSPEIYRKPLPLAQSILALIPSDRRHAPVSTIARTQHSQARTSSSGDKRKRSKCTSSIAQYQHQEKPNRTPQTR